MSPEELSEDLRKSQGRFMARRRVSVALSLLNISLMGVIALYQTGTIEHVPEPPLPGADADTVNGSAQAYSILETPDAVLAVCSYASTLALSAMGESKRAINKPLIPVAFAAKALLDAGISVKFLIDQPVKYKKFSVLCTAAAISTLAIAVLSIPEAISAIEKLRQQGD